MIKNKRQLNPFFALPISLMIFFIGLILVKKKIFPYYISTILILFIIDGYGKVLLKSLIVFIPLGALSFFLTLIRNPLNQAIFSVYRTLVMVVAAVPVISLEPIRLVRAFNQVKVPRWMTLSLLIAIRFMCIFKDEIIRIITAIKLRGINFTHSPLLWSRAFFIPFFVRVLSISETLSTSLETRGFSIKEPASQYKYIKFTLRDSLVTILLVLINISALALR